MSNKKLVSLIFSLVAIGLMVYFLLTNELIVEFQMYFKPEYYLKFSLLIIAAMLLNAAILLFKGKKGANLALAIFGYTVIQEILFDLVNVTSMVMPVFAYVLLFLCAAPSIWIAHTNTFNTEKLSKKGVMISVVIGALESLYPILF